MTKSNGLGSRATVFALAAILALGGATACATTGESSAPTSGRNEITRAQLDETMVDHVMDAVRLLRPQWLRARPMRTPGNPEPVVGVVVDGRVQGTLEDLAQIPISEVERIQFFNAADATIRFGTGYSGGAIVVTTRGRLRRGPPLTP
ncbi:MAG: hypothetical protein OXN18_07385 [Gemmatimonadota bacterium]|nr:hypothetical protein [Gemmatimonadota bacterium]